MTLAFSYIRFSTTTQADGDSQRRQDSGAAEWCKKKGIKLDTSVTFRDCGRSAFKGAHRKNPDLGGLAAFLQLVEQGRIPDDSYLIIENLDRLSRESIRPALSLLLSLLEHVRIVQLQPVETVFGKDVEPMQLMMAIMELSRGHSESAMKSVRTTANWQGAKDNGTPVPGRIPTWIDRVGDSYRLNSGEVAVREIFSLAGRGYGATRIIRELDRQKILPIGSSGRWNTGYIRVILAHHASYGVMTYGDGTSVADYFPAVISKDQFFAAQRRGKGGAKKGGSQRVYLFNEKLRHALTGDGYHASFHQHKNKKLVFVPASSKMGRPCKIVSFPVEPFEMALLQHLAEIDVRDVFPTNGHREKVLSLSGQVSTLEAKIAELTEALDEGDSVAVARVLRRKEDELKITMGELAEATAEANNPKTEAFAMCQSLLSLPQTEENRLRLRSAINRIIDVIRVVFVAHGKWRLCFAQICFAESRAFRHVTICHHGAYNSYAGSCNGKPLHAVKPERTVTDTWKGQTLPEMQNDKMHADTHAIVVEYLRKCAESL